MFDVHEYAKLIVERKTNQLLYNIETEEFKFVTQKELNKSESYYMQNLHKYIMLYVPSKQELLNMSRFFIIQHYDEFEEYFKSPAEPSYPKLLKYIKEHNLYNYYLFYVASFCSPFIIDQVIHYSLDEKEASSDLYYMIKQLYSDIKKLKLEDKTSFLNVFRIKREDDVEPEFYYEFDGTTIFIPVGFTNKHSLSNYYNANSIGIDKDVNIALDSAFYITELSDEDMFDEDINSRPFGKDSNIVTDLTVRGFRMKNYLPQSFAIYIIEALTLMHNSLVQNKDTQLFNSINKGERELYTCTIFTNKRKKMVKEDINKELKIEELYYDTRFENIEMDENEPVKIIKGANYSVSLKRVPSEAEYGNNPNITILPVIIYLCDEDKGEVVKTFFSGGTLYHPLEDAYLELGGYFSEYGIPEKIRVNNIFDYGLLNIVLGDNKKVVTPSNQELVGDRVNGDLTERVVKDMENDPSDRVA